MKSLLLFSLLLFSASLYGQDTKYFELRGTIQDPEGAAIAGIHFIVDDDGRPKLVTDSLGHFLINLAPGDHTMTAYPESLYSFRAFIRITEKGVNPSGVIFTVDPRHACCAISGVPFPTPSSLPKPSYPPAARAVRATGEVIVDVKIDREGKVTSANALIFHPLLRAAAEKAANAARFEPDSAVERTARIFYVFLSDVDGRPKSGFRLYSNTYRIEIIPDPLDRLVSY